MRVNVQLVDAETGSHIWAERFDKPVADLFDMQDEIVSRLANRLGQELAAAEACRAGRSANPDSMDLYFLGLAAFNKGLTADLLDKARSHFDRALDLDPDNVDALVGRARVDVNFIATSLSEDRAERLRSGESDLVKALRLRPDNAYARAVLGMARMYSNRALQGVADCERALAIDRNLAMAHGWIGLGKYFVGRNEETEAHVLEALRISPRDTLGWAWMLFVGIAKLHSGRDEEAVTWLSRAVELNPNTPVVHFYLAAALARLGRLQEARKAACAGLELNPSFTIARFRSLANSDNPVYLTGRERVYEGLRLELRGRQDVSDDVQVAFCAPSGRLSAPRSARWPPARSTPASPTWRRTALSSQAHRQALANRANQLWHTDTSFKATPALASVLSARIIPDDGGETEFASTRLAWDRLPDAQKAELRDLVAAHSYANSRDQIHPALMTPEERAAPPSVRWRLTWRNPANHRYALYVAPMPARSRAWTAAEGLALLHRL